jgi:hypothetical protein
LFADISLETPLIPNVTNENSETFEVLAKSVLWFRYCHRFRGNSSRLLVVDFALSAEQRSEITAFDIREKQAAA